jgi:hypothetical protein
MNRNGLFWVIRLLSHHKYDEVPERGWVDAGEDGLVAFIVLSNTHPKLPK